MSTLVKTGMPGDRVKVWKHRSVNTKITNTGDVVVTITLGSGSWVEFLSVQIGPNDYGAARTIASQHNDEDEIQIQRWALLGTTIDNLQAPALFAPEDAAAPVTNEPMIINGSTVSQGTDQPTFSAFALVANEVFTINIRALIIGQIPTVTVTGSTSGLTSVVTYNKVE